MFNKIQEWLGEGGAALADWDISRDAPYFGIEIPDLPAGAPKKYFYVWLDAPIGYLAALKKHFSSGAAARLGEPRDFAAFLADPAVEQYHFIGKDIVYFHTLFWPAMLHFSGRKTPDNVFVHGFITFSGEKMSKSRGTGISPQRYMDLGLNPEWLRYYIAAKLNARVEDLDFNPDDFIARVNSDLVGKYVNIASRAATFIAAISTATWGRHRRTTTTARTGSPSRRWRRRPRARATRRASSAACSARRCASPTASTRVSTPRSPGCSRRTPARATGCRPYARPRSPGSSSSP